MELCNEEDGELHEQLQPENIYNPTIQYFNQVVTDRMMAPSNQLPPVNPAILDQMRVEHEENEHEAFDDAFEIVYNEDEKETKVQKKRVFWRDLIAAEEGRLEQKEGIEEEKE